DEVAVCGGTRGRWAVRRRCGRAGVTGIQVVARDALRSLRPDLVVVSEENTDAALGATVSGARAAFFDRPERAPVVSACELRLAPAAGEPCFAAAESDAATLAYLDRL